MWFNRRQEKEHSITVDVFFVVIDDVNPSRVNLWHDFKYSILKAAHIQNISSHTTNGALLEYILSKPTELSLIFYAVDII